MVIGEDHTNRHAIPRNVSHGRAADLTKESCRIIATAAQFVDDNAEWESITFMMGSRLDVEATAHHAFDRKNIDKEDQRKIWAPCHLFPENEGEDDTDRLVCRKDSVHVRKWQTYGCD